MNNKSALKGSIKKLIGLLRRNKDPRIQLLRQMPKRSVCAEIGVWKGDFSSLILSITRPEKLHLIDPWEFQSEFSERMYGGSVARSQRDMDLIYEGVKEKFNNCPNVVFNRGKSETTLNDFPDNYFDWVYIDGNHYYEYVLKDLEICFRKVKQGGIIAGDDYLWGKKEGLPVREAVQHFVGENRLENSLRVIESQFMINI